MLVISIIVVIIILLLFYYRQNFDVNYNHDYIASVIQPGETYEQYYISANRETANISPYSYNQIENDTCKGTQRVDFNQTPRVRVRWEDSGNGTPNIQYVL